MRYSIDKLQVIDLGRQGENLARTVEIDVSSMLAQWPNATISMLVKRKHDTDPYVANITIRSGVLYWPITAADTASAGDGKIEIRATYGEVLAKSAIGTTRVTASLTGSETDTPEAMQEWVDTVLDAATDAQTSANASAASAQAAQQAAESVLHDVRVNGTSVVADNVANIPLATATSSGAVSKADPAYGVGMDDKGLYLNAASEAQIAARSNRYRPIATTGFDYAVKCAMGDGKGAAWSRSEQMKARERLGQEAINRDRERRLTNLEYAAQGYLYRDETDDTTAYIKQLPGDISPWISLDKIGVTTAVWNQLIMNPTFEDDMENWNTARCTATAENGIATLVPNAGETKCSINRSGNLYKIPANHKVFLSAEVKPSIALERVQFQYSDSLILPGYSIAANVWTTVCGIVSSVRTAGVYYEMYAFAPSDAPYDGTETVQWRNPKAVDLTLLFGSGNEPSVDEFLSMFPAKTYPYCEPTLTNFAPASIISCGQNIYDSAQYPFVDGYVDTRDGDMKSDSGNAWVRADGFIPCAAYRSMMLYAPAGVNVTSTIGGLAFYDENHQFLCGYSAGLYADGITVPHHATYFRFCVRSDLCDTSTFGIYVGTLRDYVPYRAPVSYDLSAIIAKYFPEGMRSAGSGVHDEIDLERKVAIQRVGYRCYDGVNTVVTGCDNTYTNLDAVYNYAYGKSGPDPKYHGACLSTIGKQVKEIYVGSTSGGVFLSSVISPFIPNVAVEGNTNAEYLAAFNAALRANPVCVNYELDTYIETPITEELPDASELPEDIEIEVNGHLIFANDQGGAFRMPMPSQQTWLVKLGGES